MADLSRSKRSTCLSGGPWGVVSFVPTTALRMERSFLAHAAKASVGGCDVGRRCAAETRSQVCSHSIAASTGLRPRQACRAGEAAMWSRAAPAAAGLWNHWLWRPNSASAGSGA